MSDLINLETERRVRELLRLMKAPPSDQTAAWVELIWLATRSRIDVIQTHGELADIANEVMALHLALKTICKMHEEDKDELMRLARKTVKG